jgi:hypothetical protein
MSINDPKRFVKKIVTPGEAAHQAALGLQGNPQGEELKRVKDDMVRMMQQSKATAIRLNAVMDYMGYIGMFLTQELDEKGFPNGPTSTPLSCSNMIFEGLVDKGLISCMPEYGFDAFFVEHQKLSDVLILLNQARHQGNATMKDLIGAAREFNDDPKRITKIRGEQIGLVEYLNTNPDKLIMDDVVALGKEFELNIDFTKEEDEDATTDQEDENKETEGVSSGEDTPQ